LAEASLKRTTPASMRIYLAGSEMKRLAPSMMYLNLVIKSLIPGLSIGSKHFLDVAGVNGIRSTSTWNKEISNYFISLIIINIIH
jgi:hypothetical protein